MDRPRVYVTRRLPEQVMERLSESFDCRSWQEHDTPVPRAVLLGEAASAQGLLTMLTDPVDESLLAAAPRLRVVSNMAVGYDNIDLAAAQARSVAVCHTPDVLTEATADLTFALLLAAARRLVEAVDYLRQDRWHSWAPLLLAGQDVYGKTLGLVGFGRIGEAVARRAAGFKMSILYHARHRKPQAEAQVGAQYVPLRELLVRSDYVCLLVPYSPQTHHLIGAGELAQMKRTAILVNTARGAVVDEAALVTALQEGVIRGAGIDVFEHEPARADHPLVRLPNVVALPHIGSATVDTRLAMALLAADNLADVLLGRDPKCRVI